MPATRSKSKWLRIIRWAIALFFACVLFLVGGVNLYIWHGSKERVYFSPKELPEHAVGLVLGTEVKRPDGSSNIHFFNRTEAAAKIYASGKVKRLIISGNPNNRGFNEVQDIRKALLQNGVPDEAMTLDSNGLRTWDSIHNAAQHEGLKTLTVITDDFHAPRAVFICRHFGIDAVAFCGDKKASGYWLYRSELREYFARVKAFIDACAD